MNNTNCQQAGCYLHLIKVHLTPKIFFANINFLFPLIITAKKLSLQLFFVNFI